MFCKECGANIPDNVRFCPSCGAQFADAQNTAGPAPAPAPEPQPQPQQQNPYMNNPQQNTYSQPNNNVPPTYTYTQPNPAGQPIYDAGIETRDIAVAIILSIVTCGIYSIYWFVKQVDDVNRAANDQGAFSGIVTFLLGMITCGIYSIYWYYQAGKKMKYAQEVRNMPVTQNAEIIYLVLSLFGFGIVAMALIQNDLNKMAAHA